MTPTRHENASHQENGAQSSDTLTPRPPIALPLHRPLPEPQDAYPSQDLILQAHEAYLQARRLDFEHRQMATIKDMLAHSPEPKPSDRDASEDIRNSTRTIQGELHNLLACRIPFVNDEIEISVASLRVKLNLIYWRIFRINALPPEILTNIFRLVAWSARQPHVGIKHRLWLTSVCSHWRSVAISDSTMWNAIWIWHVPPYQQPMAWLERAGTAPLDMYIMDANGDSMAGRRADARFTRQSMEWLLDTLFVKLAQIRVFVVGVGTWPPALVVLDKLREFGKTATKITMERFELHRAGIPYVWIGSGYQPEFHRLPIKLFGKATAPLLKHLSLNGVNIDWTASQLSNLTVLDLRRISLDVSPNLICFRQILERCPHLFKLSLDGAGPSLPMDTTLPHVSLPRLKVLTLCDFSMQYGLYVFAQIDTTAVRDLTLMNMMGEDYTPIVVAMTGRLKNVQLLTICALDVKDSRANRLALVKWLVNMPDLAYLKIAQIMPHVLDAFAVIQTACTSPPTTAENSTRHPEANVLHVVCPKLNAIEYQNMSTSTIVRFAMGRRAAGAPIRKVYVDESWISSVADEERGSLQRVANLLVTPTGARTPEAAAIILEYSSVS